MERRHLRWVSALETLEILNAPRSPRFTSKPTSYLEQRRLIYQQSEMSLGRAAPRSLLLIGHQSIPKNRLTFLFHFVARSHQLELTTPGDMVYLKHSPAMRSYVVLRGTVLLTNSVMDREGVEVSRNDFLRCGMPSLSFPLNEPLLHGCACLFTLSWEQENPKFQQLRSQTSHSYRHAKTMMIWLERTNDLSFAGAVFECTCIFPVCSRFVLELFTMSHTTRSGEHSAFSRIDCCPRAQCRPPACVNMTAVCRFSTFLIFLQLTHREKGKKRPARRQPAGG